MSDGPSWNRERLLRSIDAVATNARNAANIAMTQLYEDMRHEINALRAERDQLRHELTNQYTRIERFVELVDQLERQLALAQSFEPCTIDTKSNLITRAQFRGITEQGYVLMRRTHTP